MKIPLYIETNGIHCSQECPFKNEDFCLAFNTVLDTTYMCSTKDVVTYRCNRCDSLNPEAPDVE
jgi:hypothetical protein